MQLRTRDVQALINEFGGSIWEENGDYPVEDWASIVLNDGTRLGYWEHVANEMEQESTTQALSGISVRTADVEALMKRCGGSIWDEDSLVPVRDWKAEVRSGETRLGYWEYALQNRPRPWVLKNSNDVPPTHRFWNGGTSESYFWGDIRSARRVASDELNEVMNNPIFSGMLGLNWIHVPLAELMESADPLDAMTDELKAFVMRENLPHLSADELVVSEEVNGIQRMYLEQFLQQWEEAEEKESRVVPSNPNHAEKESGIATVQLDLRVDYELNGESVTAMASNLRSAIEREIGNGALTGETMAEVDEYAMDVMDSPAELEELAVKRLIKNGYDPLLAKAVARYGMMSPSDFIESIAGSAALLRRDA
ncbi:hypothetical protein [Marinobacter sp.]|uniref:hypothetical protein n=1 Tax=Marinobacter sp. TaxID=50741 RepID=UPI00356AC0AD